MTNAFYATLTNNETNKIEIKMTEISELNQVIDLLESNYENEICTFYRLNLLRLESRSVDFEIQLDNTMTDDVIDIIEFLEANEGTTDLDVFILSAQNQHISCLYEFCRYQLDEVYYYVVDNFSDLAQSLHNDDLLAYDIPEELEKYIDWSKFENDLKNDGWFITDGYGILDQKH